METNIAYTIATNKTCTLLCDTSGPLIEFESSKYRG